MTDTTTTPLNYARELGHFELTIKHVPERGRSQYGYGAKISTDRMLRFNGCGRMYRVYATCYGNCASHWVEMGGTKFYL